MALKEWLPLLVGLICVIYLLKRRLSDAKKSKSLTEESTLMVNSYKDPKFLLASIGLVICLFFITRSDFFIECFSKAK